MRSQQSAGDNIDAEPMVDKADRFIIREKPVGSEILQRRKQISTNILVKCLSLHFVVSIFVSGRYYF